MTLISIFDLTGRLHPALVHFPIGFLLLACFLQLFSGRTYVKSLAPATMLLFALGMISAIVSVITGLILSGGDDYESDAVNTHKWTGISVAVISVLMLIVYKKMAARLFSLFSLLLIVLVVIAGHLGAELTHGDDFLSSAFKESNKGPAIPPIKNIQQAPVYASAVEPLLKARCYSCHGPNKMKGKLRLDNPDFILKGGEDGKVVLPGKVDESNLVDRLKLPLEDDDHMPPRSKTQLTPNEISLIHWWIANGADFKKTFGQFPQDPKMKGVLAAIESGTVEVAKAGDIPLEPVGKPDEASIKKLKEGGVTVLQIAKTSNYLSLSFVNQPSAPDSILRILPRLQQQIIWLDLSDAKMDDAKMKYISQLPHLVKLNLNNTKISDTSFGELSKLKQLKYLNLVGTGISSNGLKSLKDLKTLKSVYVYHTAIDRKEYPALKTLFKEVIIDTGGYFVPTLITDTTEVKY
ncbi:MAG TPA: c-type cytochrome domain-containing protein [Flavitalea sp.]|nr:c-type cytochrome domain-containing protein [Flavitalea sp.]